MAASVKFLLSLSKIFLCSSSTFHSSLRLSFSCSMGQLPWTDNASSSHWELSCCCRDIIKRTGNSSSTHPPTTQYRQASAGNDQCQTSAESADKCSCTSVFFYQGPEGTFWNVKRLLTWRSCCCVWIKSLNCWISVFSWSTSSSWVSRETTSALFKNAEQNRKLRLYNRDHPGFDFSIETLILSYHFQTIQHYLHYNVYRNCSCVPVTERTCDTLAVQSFNVVLEFSPLEANAVGQLLTGVNTKQLHTLFTGIKHFFIILRLGLTRTTTSDQTSLNNPEAVSWPSECDTGTSHALSHLLPVWHHRLLSG